MLTALLISCSLPLHQYPMFFETQDTASDERSVRQKQELYAGDLQLNSLARYTPLFPNWFRAQERCELKALPLPMLTVASEQVRRAWNGTRSRIQRTV